MKSQTWGRKAVMLLPLVFFLLLILWVFVLPDKEISPKATDSQVAAGVSWLHEQESHSPADVEAQLKAIRQAVLDAKRDEWLNELHSGTISVWSLFDDYAILGDSRTMGFSYYGFLPSERVLADSGATINKVEEHLPELKELNPSMIFLSYGINDVGIGFWPTPEDYVNKMDETLALLAKELPDAAVYISSIIPAIDPAFDRGPAWRAIPDYNAAVKAYCAENGVPYIDITQLCADSQNLYQADGIHMMREFYPLWAVEMISEVYADDFNEETAGDGGAVVFQPG